MTFDRIQMEIALQAAVDDLTGQRFDEIGRVRRNELRHTYQVLWTTLDADAARAGRESPNTAQVAKRAVRVVTLRRSIEVLQDEINQLHTPEGVTG